MVNSFGQRAESMGLDTTLAYKGLYRYIDRYSEVVYRKLSPMAISVDQNGTHLTDGAETNLIGVFTKDERQTDYTYAGYVSDSYKFIGNDILNNLLRAELQNVGLPILEENVSMWDSLCRMRNEIILTSSQQVSQVGDVLPIMVMNNSYNGTRAASLTFGLAINNAQTRNQRVVFSFALGEMKQIHIQNSNTQLSSAIGSYMQVFGQDIGNMISQSFNTTLTETEMLSLLDIVEGIGKNKRKRISEIIAELTPPVEEGQPPPLPSAWQVFLAIVRYSSFEPNLNTKRLLENAAESVLVIPPRMFDVLERLQK